jgi:hypothetical protein
MSRNGLPASLRAPLFTVSMLKSSRFAIRVRLGNWLITPIEPVMVPGCATTFPLGHPIAT